MGLVEQAMGATGRRGGGDIDAVGLARAAVGVLAAETSGTPGGLAALRAAFERAGLAAAFDSWVGGGPNRPITAAELESALGEEVIGRLARSAGAAPARVAAALAELLPRVVDQLTPAAAPPAGGGVHASSARAP